MHKTAIGNLLAVAIVLSACVALLARSQAVPSPDRQGVGFDVASVKPNASGDPASSIGFEPGGRFRAINEPLVRLIQDAFATAATLRPEVVGAPAWVERDRFDVEAIASGTPTAEQQQLMLRAMLADRFRLGAHRETRALPVYNLVRPSPDRKLGDDLRASDGTCDAITKPGAPAPASDVLRSCMLAFGGASLRVNGMTAAQFAAAGLTRVVDRPVIDRTGLGATPYDWAIEWTDQSAQVSATDAKLPSNVFSAVEEQLGLKLVPATGQVDVVVVDHVEKPTPD